MENRFLILLVLISFSLLGCSDKPKSNYEIIKNYFKTKHNTIIDNNIDKIVVITDKDCSSCNEMLAEFSLKNMPEESTVFLITADGTRMDISPLRNSDKKVYFDWNIDPFKYKILSQTGVIILKNGDIDTVVTINSREIMKQLNFLSEQTNY